MVRAPGWRTLGFGWGASDFMGKLHGSQRQIVHLLMPAGLARNLL
jgi:hypothetical protein